MIPYTRSLELNSAEMADRGHPQCCSGVIVTVCGIATFASHFFQVNRARMFVITVLVKFRTGPLKALMIISTTFKICHRRHIESYTYAVFESCGEILTAGRVYRDSHCSIRPSA